MMSWWLVCEKNTTTLSDQTVLFERPLQSTNLSQTALVHDADSTSNNFHLTLAKLVQTEVKAETVSRAPQFFLSQGAIWSEAHCLVGQAISHQALEFEPCFLQMVRPANTHHSVMSDSSHQMEELQEKVLT